MSLPGGRILLFRGVALLLAGACALTGLSGCEFADDGADQTSAPSRTSRPAPPSPPPADPALANAENRNFKDLGPLLGTGPDDVVLKGVGGLGGVGFRKSVRALAKGRYTIAAACVGAPNAYLSISQDGLRDGSHLELNLDCGKATKAQVDIKAGPVQVQGFYPTAGPGTGAVAGFWLVPAATGS